MPDLTEFKHIYLTNQSTLSIVLQFRPPLNRLGGTFNHFLSTACSYLGPKEVFPLPDMSSTQTPLNMHLHVSVPAFASGIKISPAGSILDRHEWLLQVTQHGNHVVMDSASRIVRLQEIWTFKQKILKPKRMRGALRQREQDYFHGYREFQTRMVLSENETPISVINLHFVVLVFQAVITAAILIP